MWDNQTVIGNKVSPSGCYIRVTMFTCPMCLGGIWLAPISWTDLRDGLDNLSYQTDTWRFGENITITCFNPGASAACPWNLLTLQCGGLKFPSRPWFRQIHEFLAVVHSVEVGQYSLSMERQNRTSHACDRCRAMRAKCSGDVRCEKCVKDDTVCIYGDRKREKNKK